MASLAFAVAGAGIGAQFGYAQAGWLIGSAIGNALFPGSLPDQVVEGPRVSDLKVQASSYGQMIPWVWGTMRLAGNLVWSTEIQEHASTSSQTTGGKGGGGPEQTTTTTTYTYTVDCAVAVCDRTIAGVRRIWANGKLIYDVSASASAEVNAASNAFARAIRVYTGSESQGKDALEVAYLGDENTPAYRGVARVVFETLDLAPFGNRMPNFEFEVVSSGTAGEAVVTVDPASTYAAARGTITPDGLLLMSYTAGATRAARLVHPFTFATIREYPFSVYSLTPSFCWLNPQGDMLIKNLDSEWYVWPAIGTPVKVQVLSGGTNAMDTPSTGAVVDADGAFWFGARPVSSPSQRLSLMRLDPGATVPAEVYVFGSGGGAPSINDVVMADDGSFYLIDTTRVDHVSRDGVLLHSIAQSGGQTGTVASDGSLWGYDTVGGNLYRFPADLSSRTTIASDLGAAGGAGYRRVAQDFATGDVLVGYGSLRRYTAAGALVSTTTAPSGMTNLATITTRREFPHYLIATNGEGASGTQFAAAVKRTVVTPGAVALSTVVGDLCAAVGLAGADVDVAALTATVDGYVVGRRGSARAAIEPLMRTYGFDAVESDDLLRFRLRGAASVATILEEELAAHFPGTTPPEPVDASRRLESELPAEVSVIYADKDADYQQGSQYARRLIGGSRDVTTVELPLALSAAKAAEVAETILFELWTAREERRFATTRKYADVDPGDQVTIVRADGSTLAVRTTGKDESRGLIQWTGTAEDTSQYTRAVAGAGYGNAAQSVGMVGGTDLRLLDIPILRDEDDDAGCYAAAAGYFAGWRGAELYKSTDGGASFGATQNAFLTPAVLGIAVTALGNFQGGNVFDQSSTVEVTIGSGALASASESAVLNGANVALLGGELIQFQTATLLAAGKYRLTGLLRGRRGTEAAMTTHAAGEAFVLLSTSTALRVKGSTAEIGLARQWKAPAFGQSLVEASPVAFTNTGAGLLPMAPVHLGGGRNAAGDVTIAWTRRTRVGGEWRDSVDAALGEATEAYEVEVWDSAFTTLKRTITGLATPTTTYTAAQQTTDFGSTQAAVYLRVFQVSASAGRGTKLQGSV